MGSPPCHTTLTGWLLFCCAIDSAHAFATALLIKRRELRSGR
ncbi:hypothetical protein JD77_00295 [Micromonospora olivasterospora]|uniref:Uncharacterized protein n=1 Tax=Micromonospora olivasterospora TaxID=1880 RepID=A0A562I2T4_MICOL|nr:hypothetical protein JD77_00295 [Micromonospora olivasterospora]